MRVLVIEDDDEMADTIAVGLRRQNMAVDVAYDGASGLDRATFSDYDVIVLDRDLPARDRAGARRRRQRSRAGAGRARRRGSLRRRRWPPVSRRIGRPGAGGR